MQYISTLCYLPFNLFRHILKCVFWCLCSPHTCMLLEKHYTSRDHLFVCGGVCDVHVVCWVWFASSAAIVGTVCLHMYVLKFLFRIMVFSWHGPSRYPMLQVYSTPELGGEGGGVNGVGFGVASDQCVLLRNSVDWADGHSTLWNVGYVRNSLKPVELALV